MNTLDPLPKLVIGNLVVAVLSTLLVQGGWLIWIPMLLAVYVWFRLSKSH